MSDLGKWKGEEEKSVTWEKWKEYVDFFGTFFKFSWKKEYYQVDYTSLVFRIDIIYVFKMCIVYYRESAYRH